jgi:hypothetical protein
MAGERTTAHLTSLSLAEVLASRDRAIFRWSARRLTLDGCRCPTPSTFAPPAFTALPRQVSGLPMSLLESCRRLDRAGPGLAGTATSSEVAGTREVRGIVTVLGIAMGAIGESVRRHQRDLLRTRRRRAWTGLRPSRRLGQPDTVRVTRVVRPIEQNAAEIMSLLVLYRPFRPHSWGDVFVIDTTSRDAMTVGRIRAVVGVHAGTKREHGWLAEVVLKTDEKSVWIIESLDVPTSGHEGKNRGDRNPRYALKSGFGRSAHWCVPTTTQRQPRAARPPADTSAALSILAAGTSAAG